MEAMASAGWGYQENIDQLKELLLYTTFELESAKNEAKEEMRRNEEYVNQLLQLLKLACQERDEARDQLQRLLNKLLTPSSPLEISPRVLPGLIQQPTNVSLNPTIGNSSITESDSISETHNNHHSYGSPPVDSLLDAVSSPDLSNMNVADSSNNRKILHQPFIQESNRQSSMGSTVMSVNNEIDQSYGEIEKLVRGKPLPQKGKLLQSVMEAGPLLHTLLLAGPLPRWRNPPPLQPLQIPQISIKGCPTELNNQLRAAQNSTTLSYRDMSHGSSPQMYSTSMLNFSSGGANCLNKGQVLSSGVKRDCIVNSFSAPGKRQRFQ